MKFELTEKQFHLILMALGAASARVSENFASLQIEFLDVANHLMQQHATPRVKAD